LGELIGPEVVLRTAAGAGPAEVRAVSGPESGPEDGLEESGPEVARAPASGWLSGPLTGRVREAALERRT
jgi:hypothetical protein